MDGYMDNYLTPRSKTVGRGLFYLYVFLLSLCSDSNICHAYKPVLIIHGVLSGNESMLFMTQRIQMLHPGTAVIASAKYAGWTSLAPMWQQVLEIGADVMKMSEKYPDGINLIGYSQGGLIARSILEQFPEHNVKTFISLSAPQAGQYGTQFLHLFFPGLVCKTAYELFYSAVGQHTSVGNYWNDPHHEGLYHNYSRFLPYLNNELPSILSDQFKFGLSKLDRMVLIGGPDDGVITPWQSSHFGYFDSDEKVVEMRDRACYLNDSIGLQTLDTQGKLTLIEQSGISHFDWHKDVHVIDKLILPHLN